MTLSVRKEVGLLPASPPGKLALVASLGGAAVAKFRQSPADSPASREIRQALSSSCPTLAILNNRLHHLPEGTNMEPLNLVHVSL